MMFLVSRLAILSLTLCLGVTATSGGGESFVNTVYFTNWGIYGRNFQPSELSADKLSHVLYAFMRVEADGTVRSGDTYADIEKHYPGDSWADDGTNAYGCVKQLYSLKRKNRKLKVMLSIGGWTWSSNFAAVASSDATRTTFARTAVRLMSDWGFDGVDVDWEFPKNTKEAGDLILLLQSLRAELDSYATRYAPDHHFLLSIAASAGPAQYQVYEASQMKQLGEIVDYINLMAYDFTTGASHYSGHSANLLPNPGQPNTTPFSTKAAVEAYIQGGIPPRKIVLGMPLYGHSFKTVGLGQPTSGVGSGHWEPGLWDYKDLPRQGATIHYDQVADASYSYDQSIQEFISYDTRQAVSKKVAYIKSSKLGGSMFWEASGDKNGSDSLINTSFSGLTTLDQTLNYLSYPSSQYENIRKGLDQP
ncbi:hypothetical protein PCL_07083 [Purpureocillium lilacinum]|uniref:chitinase n=1 Tax=Purpureocillium lilacinum TaxID=33203 RepID=A0A2U3DTA9_PURLI|nr:hypothetical protein PCL_07083 [Purpureocillium lilacinum]